jgi:hypothetical protein
MSGNSSQLTPSGSRPDNREAKRLTLILVGSIVALDSAVIGIYYALHIADKPVKTQEIFIAVWVVLTLLVVTTLMKRIRKLRRRR